MSALSHFLSHSQHYERTHQLVLFTLLHHNEFVKTLTGLEINNHSVKMEPLKGTFDLGLMHGNVPTVLFELKMWSNLSENQLSKQTNELMSKYPNAKCFHILLGLTHFQYLRFGEVDSIAQQTQHKSRKIGYEELIDALTAFSKIQILEKDLKELATEYQNTLQSQYNQLLAADESQRQHNPKAYYFPIYHQLRLPLLKTENLVSNIYAPGISGESILNFTPWWYCIFQEQEFQVFHEIINGIYHVKAMSSAPNHIKKAFQTYLTDKLKGSLESEEEWNFKGAATKYMQIAQFKNPYHPNDLKDWLPRISQTHRILTDICDPKHFQN